MTKQLYIIEYENAHWCGGQLNVLVWAENADDAGILASDHMEETQRELFSDEMDDVPDDEKEEYENDSFVSINSVKPFGPAHDEWQFYQMPDQSEFYPVIGESDEDCK
jgi:hypothetical protein